MTATHSAIKRLALWMLGWIERYRYIKFGIVGLSGLVVNFAVLYVCHEFIFYEMESAYKRPYISHAIAISLSTINNFCWNRLWTWSDRVKTFEAEQTIGSVSLSLVAVEFRQYVLATGFGSALQYVLAQLLSGTVHYLLATFIAIVAASVTNFLANDKWTFKRH